MTPPRDDDILDDPFHGCAFKAFVEFAVTCKGVPDVEATKRRDYDLYQETLDEMAKRR